MTNKKQKMNDEELEFLVPLNQRPFMRVDKFEINRVTVFLDEDIREPSLYRDLFHALKTAGENDVFDFHINSKGGRLDTAVQMVHGITSTAGTVNAFLEGDVDSAASIIALQCHNITVLPYASMLCHTASWVTGDFTGRLVDSVLHTERYIKDFMQDCYEGFLTPAEIAELHTGREIWCRSKDIITRLNQRDAYLSDLHVQDCDECQAAIAEEQEASSPKKKRGKKNAKSNS